MLFRSIFYDIIASATFKANEISCVNEIIEYGVRGLNSSNKYQINQVWVIYKETMWTTGQNAASNRLITVNYECQTAHECINEPTLLIELRSTDGKSVYLKTNEIPKSIPL